ncbi:hypothetical protein [Streptomyces regalis]|nr:hypothetical protein [Streptomyces regalis]
MAPVAVKIATTSKVEEDEIEFVDDLDAVSGTEVMLGCGNDNPY